MGPAGAERRVPPVGAVPLEARAPAPDVARGAMLLLIALANVHLYLYGRPLGVRSYPAGLSGADRVVAAVQLTLVDGRAYPLFALLFGYGIALLARRLGERTATAEVVATVRRRGGWLVVIGAAHAVLLWPGDIVAAYGVVGAALAGVLVAGTTVSVATTVVVGMLCGAFLGTYSGFAGADTAPVPSIALADPVAAVPARLAEWGGNVLVSSMLSVVGLVALGAWAARHRVLDEPGRHHTLLVRVAAVGLPVAVLGGLPLALAGAGVWAPGTGALMAAGVLHTVSGYAGGAGYAAVFGLLAARRSGVLPIGRTAQPSDPVGRECRSSGGGPVVRALAACGQRSLSCYLGQSVLFALLLPEWALGLGARVGVAEAALLAVTVWFALLLAAVVSARAGYRGPAEVLLRRLTYGRVSVTRQEGGP